MASSFFPASISERAFSKLGSIDSKTLAYEKSDARHIVPIIRNPSKSALFLYGVIKNPRTKKKALRLMGIDIPHSKPSGENYHTHYPLLLL